MAVASARVIVANALVRRVLEIIETQYTQPVTLPMLSTLTGRQGAYLGRVFMKEVGASVRTYVTRVRLQHAAALIREGVKVEAAALSVGYRSKKSFYRQFKRLYGTTPVPYRSLVEHSRVEAGV